MNGVVDLSESGPTGLQERYCEMANDPSHEAEAEAWCEELIGDAIAPD